MAARAAGGIVGRVEELRALDTLLRARRRHAAGFVALAGEPGIGKTSLLAELCARAHARVADPLAFHGAPPSARAHHVERSATLGRRRRRATAGPGRPGDHAARARDRGPLIPGGPGPHPPERPRRAAGAPGPAGRGGRRVRAARRGRRAGAGGAEPGRAPRTGPAGRTHRAVGGDRPLRGRHRQASAQLASALDELGGRPSPERSALEIELAAEPGYTRTVSAASARGERALLTAEPLGDPAQVHLSEKTVETHLARAFAKLGVRRRAALASRIAERS